MKTIWPLLFLSLTAFSAERTEEINSKSRVIGTEIHNNTKGLIVSGHARFRWQARNDVAYKKPAHDDKLLRIRPAFSWQVTEDTKVLFEPQFSRTFGSDGHSGGLIDPNLTFHRGFIQSKIHDMALVTIGRQGLPYGDEVVLSTLEWHNTARSHDAIKLSLSVPFGEGKIDIINSTMNTNDTSNTLIDDLTLKGVYTMWNWGPFLKELDLYYLIKGQNNLSTANVKNSMWGVRAKSKIGNFDYRIEHTSQKTDTVDATTADYNGAQTDIELGYAFPRLKSLRIGLEWFKANDEYDHMMPLTHAYLGIADVLGRSNITGLAFHAKVRPFEKWAIKFDYHLFERDSISSDAITVAPNQIAKTATSYASNSSSKKLGSEYDIFVKYMSSKKTNISLGIGLFQPGAYFKDYGSTAPKDLLNKDDIKFAYLQYVVKM
jgi:hypothetical protein